MKAKTPTERKRLERKRLKEAGYMRIEIKTKPVHVKSIRAYARDLNEPEPEKYKCWLTEGCEGEMVLARLGGFCNKCKKETGA